MSTVAKHCEQARESIAERQRELAEVLASASKLVSDAALAHGNGDLPAARDLAADAGDLLYKWLGDSDPTGDLETALWADDPDGWETYMLNRARKRPD